MAETAAYLVDHIIPRVSVRRWVLSFPIPLGSLFAVYPELLSPVLRIVHRAIHSRVIEQTGVDEDAPVFIEAPAPSSEQLQALLHKIIRRILKLHTLLGHLIEEDGITYMARSENLDPDNPMTPLQAAASTWRIAAGPRAGRKVLTLFGAGARSPTSRTRELCANHQGFSLHAGVHCDANARQGIEQLCRYIMRPAISNERLSSNCEGNVVLKLNSRGLSS